MLIHCLLCFFFNDRSTPELYTLSLHDALPIFDVPVLVEVAKSGSARRAGLRQRLPGGCGDFLERAVPEDRKSTRLNSSHITISYAVFCLKKKTKRDR